jgi:hypothetical protein
MASSVGNGGPKLGGKRAARSGRRRPVMMDKDRCHSQRRSRCRASSEPVPVGPRPHSVGLNSSDPALTTDPVCSCHALILQLSSIYRPMTAADNVHAVIAVDRLTYHHGDEPEPSLRDVAIHLPRGSRTVLIGANGG